MKKQYVRFTIELDTSEEDIFVSVTHEDMSQEELDNSYEYVNSIEEAYEVITQKIRECF